MDSIERRHDGIHDAEQTPVVETADGFVVVSRFRVGRPLPPYRYDYSYNHYATQGDAYEHFTYLERGEFEGWEAVSILPSIKGVPLGAKVIL